MKNLSEIGLCSLKQNEMEQINGGTIMFPWASAFKWGKRILELADLYDAGSNIVDGYNACRN